MVQTRPSDCWNGPERLKSTRGRLFKQIHRVLDTVDLRHLEHLALSARKRVEEHLDAAITCCIDASTFSYGLNSVVFEVAFSDNVYWVAKVQHAAIRKSDAVYMLSEIATMKLVQEQTTIPVPRVFGYQTHLSDGFKFPFILMEFLPGRDVGGSFAGAVPAEYLPKVAKQLADVLFQLESKLSFEQLGILWCGTNCSEPTRIISLPPEDDDHPLGRLPSTTTGSSPQTSLEWFYKHRQEENDEAVKKHPEDPEWNTACWVLKDAISHFVLGDRVHGPFPLCHVDFHHGNILFDEEYNLTGVIDWGKAQTVPLERLALSPEFVTGFLCSKERKESGARLLSLVMKSLQDLQLQANSGEESEGNAREDSKSESGYDDEPETASQSEVAVDDADSQNTQQTTLADIFGTVEAEIANRCTICNPRVALWYGKMVQELIYGEHVSWEQMVLALGKKTLH